MKFLFVLPVLSEAYYRKRIDHIREQGIDCSVYGFTRNHYQGKSWDLVPVDLGRVQDEKYLLRLLNMMRSVITVRRAVKDHRVLYAFNLDILFLIWMASLFHRSKKKIIYDVADVRPILVQNGLLATILRIAERFLLKKVDLVVVASPEFIDGYFRDLQKATNEFFVLENKVDGSLNQSLNQIEQADKTTNNIIIGYFGGLRCRKSLEFLYQLMRNEPENLKLILRGFFFRTEEYQSKFSNIEDARFKGSYTDPDDLEEIYSEVDMVWSAHMHGSTNTKWAISNRFYQACTFKRPLIAQAGTIDAQRVSYYKIGCIIDLNDKTSTLERIKNLDHNEIRLWKKNMEDMPEEVYTLTDEYQKLIELINHSR